jgi:arylsulfatase A-like enzyme
MHDHNIEMPRNVLWITTDHLRWDCLGVHDPAVHTPNIDRLARGGVDFSRCYGQNPLCMPSRASFMTGLYPAQTGVLYNGQELPPDCPLTVARVFKPHFTTCQFGKLHFQCHENRDLDPRARHDYGFDILNLAEEPGCYEDAYMTWLRGERPDLVPVFRLPRPTSPQRTEERRSFRVLDAPWEYSYSGWLATMVDRHLTSWAGSNSRQFIHAGFYAPHPPLNPTREMMAPYLDRETPAPHWRDGEADDKPATLRRMLQSARDLDDGTLRAYRRHFHAMVTGVDLAVGRILDALQRIGQLDDTLIVFSSDHGDFCGDHRMILKNCAWYEEVLRLPLILHWPRRLQAQTVDGLTEMVDVLPTLLGFSGLPVPAAMAGRDLSSELLSGRSPTGRADVYAVDGPGHLMLRTERWKYIRHIQDDGVGEVLFDLEADPREYVNRANDPACAEVLHHLRDRLLSRHVAATRSVLPRSLRF